MISMEKVLDSKPKIIYHSANTVWWTHDPADLGLNSMRIPVDVFGSPLLETTNVSGWLNAAAIEAHDAYGSPGKRVRNFMMAHAQNIKIVCDKMPQRSFDKVEGFEVFTRFLESIEQDLTVGLLNSLGKEVRAMSREAGIDMPPAPRIKSDKDHKYFSKRNGPYGQRYF